MARQSLGAKPKVFGSPARTDVLVLLGLLEESYPRELARLTGINLSSVQNIVDSLDVEGIVVTRLVGKERKVTLNPRYYAVEELRRYLSRLATGRPDLQRIASTFRRRPRRARKPL